MRVSTFFADTLPAAMAQVRDALGPKAIVLSWRNTRGGVEISASVQAEYVVPPVGAHEPVVRPQHQEQGQRPERSQPQRPHERLEQQEQQEQQDLLSNHFSPNDFLPPQMPVSAKPMGPKPVTRGLAALVKRQPATAQQIATQSRLGPTPQAPTPQAPRQQPQAAAAPNRPAPAQSKPIALPQTSHLTTFLVRAGLTSSQAQSFGTSTTPELRRALSDCIARALSFAPIEAIPPKPLIMVGPPGCGKSTCAAKLAARTIASGHEVLLLSADAERCGGSDQLAALAKRLGARFETITTLTDLNELVGEARARGIVVFIDAPSACPAQPADMRATARMIDDTRLEAVLCLPADMRPDDMQDLADAYQAIGVKRAIATRLDLTTRRASVLHALKQATLALAQISATPYISGGVAIASAPRLASLLLEPFEDALIEDVA